MKIFFKNRYFLFSFFSFVFFLISRLAYNLFLSLGFLIFQNKSGFFIFSSAYFLPILILAILAFIIFSLYQIKKEDKLLLLISLSLILGGGLSNLFDRVIRGGVADYFDLKLFKTNLADFLIFIGISLFLIYHLKKRKSNLDADVEQGKDFSA